MTVELVQNALGWCALINLALMIWWFLMFAVAHDWMHRMHSRWFDISAERFDSIHYAGMAIYKMAIIFFNIVPYLALRIVT